MDASTPRVDVSVPESGTSEALEDTHKPESNSSAPNFTGSPEKLQEEKRILQNLDASGNIAENQIFINALYMGNSPQYKEAPNAPKRKKEVSFDLGDQKECERFVEEYRNGEYLALAVTLAIFDVVAISDLPGIESNLISFLPDVDEPDDDGKAVNSHYSDPYLSLQSKLTVIGAKSFIRNDGQSCVGFGDKSKQILLNIWTQFPALRNPIISWLMELNHIHKYRTSFELQQIIGAFSKIISIDFSDAEKRIFPKLYSSPNNMFFLGTLTCLLVKNPYMKGSARSLLLKWARSNSEWIWKSALLSYSGMDTPEEYDDLKTLLQDKLKSQNSIFMKIDNTHFLMKGQIKNLDSSPVLQNEHPYLPVRDISTALGGTVSWDSERQQAVIDLGQNTIRMAVGSSEVFVNDEEIPLVNRQLPISIDSKMYIDLQAFSILLGFHYYWFPKHGFLAISSNIDHNFGPLTLQTVEEKLSPYYGSKIVFPNL